MRCLLTILLVLSLAALCHGARATNIVTVSAGSLEGITEKTTIVEGWTQTSAYQNVTISTLLFTDVPSISGIQGTVYLVNQVGPGATASNNVAPPVTISGLSTTFTSRTLWSGLTLQAGTYYVVFVPTNSDQPSLSPAVSIAPTVTTGTGVSFIDHTETDQALAAFPPATGGLIDVFGGDSVVLTVTGDAVGPSPVPVPPSLWLMLTVIGGMVIYFGLRTRRGATQGR